MNTRIFAVPALALFAVLFAQTASSEGITTEAADDTDAVTATFKKLDANNDGYVSEAEAQADPAIADAFADADTNGDGQLSMEELSKIELGAAE